MSDMNSPFNTVNLHALYMCRSVHIVQPNAPPLRCIAISVRVCLSVCPRTYPESQMSKLHLLGR